MDNYNVPGSISNHVTNVDIDSSHFNIAVYKSFEVYYTAVLNKLQIFRPYWSLRKQLSVSFVFTVTCLILVMVIIYVYNRTITFSSVLSSIHVTVSKAHSSNGSLNAGLPSFRIIRILSFFYKFQKLFDIGVNTTIQVFGVSSKDSEYNVSFLKCACMNCWGHRWIHLIRKVLIWQFSLFSSPLYHILQRIQSSLSWWRWFINLFLQIWIYFLDKEVFDGLRRQP